MEVWVKTFIVILYFGILPLARTQQTGRTSFTDGIVPIIVIDETTNEITHPGREHENNGLQCITDNRPCCRVGSSTRIGEWYFPNRTAVPILRTGNNIASTFYRNRGDSDGTVNLNRVNSDVISPTGQFCCVVPDSSDINQTVCANITTVDVMIVRISQATSVTGEKFALQCSVLGAGDFLTQIEWLNSERMRINTSNSFSVQLRFSPLQASHNGIYTCKATVEDVVLEKNYTVYVKLPAPRSVTVTSSIQSIGHEAMAVILTCNVTLILSPAVDVPVTVRIKWTGPYGPIISDTAQPVHVMRSTTTYTSTATISSRERDESGVYTCTAATSSMSHFLNDSDSLIGTININPVSVSSAPHNFTALPEATTVLFSWYTPLYPRAVANYTLTCVSLVEGVDTLIMTYTEAGRYTLGGFRPATAYNCSVFATNVIGNSALSIVNVTTVDESLRFQLWLMEVDNYSCTEWTVTDAGQKLSNISSAIVDNIETHCQCGFVLDRITNEAFQCTDASPESVIYTATIHGTSTTNSSELFSHVEKWASDGTTVTILNKVVNISYTDLAEVCCTEMTVPKQEITSSLNETRAKDNDHTLFIIIGGSSAVGLVVIVIIVIVVIALLVKHKHQKRGKIRIHKRECIQEEKEVNKYENLCASRVQEGVYIEECDYGEIKGHRLEEDEASTHRHSSTNDYQETQITQDNEPVYINSMTSHHDQSKATTSASQYPVLPRNELAAMYNGSKSHHSVHAKNHTPPREGCEINEEVYDDIVKLHQPTAKIPHDLQHPAGDYVINQSDGPNGYDYTAIPPQSHVATRYQQLLTREGDYENSLEDYNSITDAQSQSQDDDAGCEEYQYVSTKPRYYYRPSVK